MKQYLHALDYVLWIVTIFSECVLLALAIRKGIRRLLPSYVYYLGFLCSQAVLLFAIAQWLPYRFYFWSYYGGLILETCLWVVVLYDIFRRVFNPLDSLPSGSLAKLVASIVIISVIAITLAISRPAVNSSAITVLVRTLHRTTEFVVALSLWSLVMYARSLGIPWRSRIAGITAGLLFYLSVDTAAQAAEGFASQPWFGWIDRIGNTGFLVSIFMWALAVRRQEIVVELPTPAALDKLRSLVAQMQLDSGRLAVQGKTKWSEK